MSRIVVMFAALAAMGCSSSPTSSFPSTSSGSTGGTSTAATSTGGVSSTASSSTGGTAGASTSNGSASSAGSSTSGGSSGNSVPGVVLMSRLVGLWSGQASQTPLGSFPLMNMDLRPASGDVLFSRDDLDANDNLRFDFSIETYQGNDALVFRNGGLFLGLLRDTRTVLVDNDDVAGTYHFCAETDAGCSYVDAVFTLADSNNLTLDVHVNGSSHLLWVAQQVESQPVPNPFPADSTSQGDGTAGFPPLPGLVATVTWNSTLNAPTNVWVLLSTEPCTAGSACNISRSLETSADAGTTSATLTFGQILPGAYYATAVVDVNNTLTTAFVPSAGDYVSVPNTAVMVNAADTQDTTTLPAVFRMP